MFRKIFISQHTGRPSRPLIVLVVIALLLILAGILLSFALNRNAEPIVINETTPIPKPEPSPPPAIVQPPRTIAELTVPTTVDIVRVSLSGDMLVAGRAEPNATVNLIFDQQNLGSTAVDAEGDWVFIGRSELVAGEHYLEFSTTHNDQTIASDDDILVLIPAEPVTLQDGSSPPRPFVALLPGDSDRAARLLQRALPEDSRAPVGPHFTVETLEYAPARGFFASGTVQAEAATLLLYVDDSIVGGTTISGKGPSPVPWEFRSQLNLDIEQSHRVRVDMQIDNRVVLRRLLEFDPSGIGSSRAELTEGGKPVVRVSKGDTLWSIAHRELGSGYRYLAITMANPDQITDPNVILPGQVFDLPDEATIQEADKQIEQEKKRLRLEELQRARETIDEDAVPQFKRQDTTPNPVVKPVPAGKSIGKRDLEAIDS